MGVSYCASFFQIGLCPRSFAWAMAASTVSKLGAFHIMGALVSGSLNALCPRMAARSAGTCSQMSVGMDPTYRRAAYQGRQIRFPLDPAVVQAVPRQRGRAATARPGLSPGQLLAMHPTVRGNGSLIAEQPLAEADQEWRPRRPPRPRHHLPVGRGRRNRADGGHDPHRHPTTGNATAMRMTAIHAQTERKSSIALSAALVHARTRQGRCSPSSQSAQFQMSVRPQKRLGAENACPTGGIRRA